MENLPSAESVPSSPGHDRITSAYQLAVPDAVKAQLEDDPLLLRIDVHAETILLHEYAEHVVRTRPVSAHDLAQTLARELDLSSGLLPPDTLWWASTARGVQIAIWQEPRIWMVRLRERSDRPPRRLSIPLPGLVFVCLRAGEPPYVFAARERPTAETAQLYRCPAPNVFDTGRICTGSHAFPADPARVPAAFFESFFSLDLAHGKSQRHPSSIIALWDEIAGTGAYPLDDLCAAGTVAEAMRIGG